MKKNCLDPFPTFELDRIILSKLPGNDIEHLLEITSFNGRVTSKDQLKTFLAKLEENRLQGEAITWGIFKENTLIGTIGYYRGFDGNTGEVGYVVREAYRNKGFLTEAMKPILQFGFEVLKLYRITAFTKDANTPSLAVLKKFGFYPTEGFHEDYRCHELLANVKAQ